MPFLAPIGGALGGALAGGTGAAIGQAAGGIGGSLLGKLFGGSAGDVGKLQKQMLEQQLRLSGQAGKYARQGASAIDQARNYWTPVMQSQGGAFRYNAPEMMSAASRFNAGRQSLLNMGPRTGGTTFDPYAFSSWASTEQMKAQREGAKQMEGLGSSYGNLASTLMNAGQNAGRSLLDQQRWAYEREKEEGGNLYDLIFGHTANIADRFGGQKPWKDLSYIGGIADAINK